jgi:catechol 2,3-dioxygenase-like lactoylglutathione lyase family enzyme
MSTVAEPVTAVRTSATPRLTFKDAAKAIEFYKQAFGAKETMRFEPEKDSGTPRSRSVTQSIMLSEEWPEGGRFSAETLGSSPVQLSLQCPTWMPSPSGPWLPGMKNGSGRFAISFTAAAREASSIPSAIPGTFPR